MNATAEHIAFGTNNPIKSVINSNYTSIRVIYILYINVEISISFHSKIYNKITSARVLSTIISWNYDHQI